VHSAFAWCGYLLHGRSLGDEIFLPEVGENLRTVGIPPHFVDSHAFYSWAMRWNSQSHPSNFAGPRTRRNFASPLKEQLFRSDCILYEDLALGLVISSSS